MKAHTPLFAATLAALVSASAAVAQQPAGPALALNEKPAASAPADTARPEAAAKKAARASLANFEAPKITEEFAGLKIDWHAGFSQSFQALKHSNTATPGAATKLQAIRPGFNLAMANLGVGTPLAKGIRVDLESYMSARHHEEFWVKGGYATIDASPIDVPVLNKIMEYTTIRAGHYEINYGDAHFRRSDGGNTVRNPFVENYLLDAFTTEIGADATVRVGDAFVMGGVTTGENKGNIKDGAVDAKPGYLGKIGVDKQVNELVRVRLSASTYQVSSSPSATLYAGDRTGSHYWGVLEKDGFVETDQFTSGRLNPGFRNELAAYQINPFVKVGGLELFGVIEKASGKAATETSRRDINQYAGDAVYRFLGDKLYVGGRYNVVKGDLSATAKDITVDRKALSGGWFITPNMLTKVEYVTQSYDGFAATDIRNGGKFHGLVMEGAIAF